MCDPVSIGLAVASSVAGAVMANQQASAQEKIANEQAQASYKAAEQRVNAEYAEANRQISEVQGQEVEEASDLIRAANEQLGTLRAAETALSDASLGNLYFENYYTNSVDLQRLDENTEKQIAAGEANKGAAQQNYLNTTNAAKNQAQNVMMQTSASRNSAKLQIISSAASAGAGAYRQQKLITAIKGE